MPNPTIPAAVWTMAETEEMKEIAGLYGKTFHFWQTDRGDELPLGMPMLMGSFTEDSQVCWVSPVMGVGGCWLGEGRGEGRSIIIKQGGEEEMRIIGDGKSEVFDY